MSTNFIRADKLKNMDLKNVEYLVEDLIPKGTLCALVGESDTGKVHCSDNLQYLSHMVIKNF